MTSSAQRGRRASVNGAAPLRPGEAAPHRPDFDPRVAYRAVVLAVGLLAAGLLFEQLVQIVMLVTIALVIAVPLAASATWLRRFHIPRAVGAVLSLLAGAAVTGLLLAFLVPTFVSQVNDFVAQLPSTVALDHAKKDKMYDSPDAPTAARPDLKALQAFVRRKFPGFPVPDALP